MDNDHVLGLNAYLKNIEFVLGTFDNGSDNKTLGEVRREFRERFHHSCQPTINQYFCIVRLIPLMFMSEQGFLKGSQDGEKINAIRNAFAHNTVDFDEIGYMSLSNRENRPTVRLLYSEFVDFIHRVENAFYSGHESGSSKGV